MTLPGNTGSRSKGGGGGGGGRSFREQYVLFAILFVLIFGTVAMVALLPQTPKEIPAELPQEEKETTPPHLSSRLRDGDGREGRLADMIDRISKREKHLEALLERLGDEGKEGVKEVGGREGRREKRFWEENKEDIQLSRKEMQKKIEKNAIKLLSAKRAMETAWGNEINNGIPFEDLLPQINSGAITFAWIKPDAFAHHSLSHLLSLISPDFSLIAYKIFQMEEKHVHAFYEEHLTRPFFPKLTEFMTSGPAIALILKSTNDSPAVEKWRELIGPTNSETAREVSPRSLRALFGTDGTKNAFHGSDSIDSVKREVELVFFDPLFEDGFRI